jgi:hypothetical protein
MSTAALTNWNTEASPRFQARIAGGLYLINILTGVFAIMFVRAAVLAPGDAAATANNILAHQMRFRLGFVAEIIACMTNIGLAVIFYNLFKVVNRSLAFVDVFCTLIGTSIEAVSLVNHFAPLVFLAHGTLAGVFTLQQLQAQAYVSLQLMDVGLGIALVFFAIGILVTAYLILKSNFLPRIIGALLAIEGAGYLINSFTQFLAPALQARIFPYFAITAIGEISLALWLFIMGVNAMKWKEMERVAGLST